MFGKLEEKKTLLSDTDQGKVWITSLKGTRLGVAQTFSTPPPPKRGQSVDFQCSITAAHFCILVCAWVTVQN